MHQGWGNFCHPNVRRDKVSMGYPNVLLGYPFLLRKPLPYFIMSDHGISHLHEGKIVSKLVVQLSVKSFQTNCELNTIAVLLMIKINYSVNIKSKPILKGGMTYV